MTLFGSTNAQIESPRNVLTYFGQIIDALAHHVTSVLVRNKGNNVLEELNLWLVILFENYSISRPKFLPLEVPQPKKDCTWDNWKKGECSVTCGGGTRTETRDMTARAVNGGYCNLNGGSRIVECNTHACPRRLSNIVTFLDYKFSLIFSSNFLLIL